MKTESFGWHLVTFSMAELATMLSFHSSSTCLPGYSTAPRRPSSLVREQCSNALSNAVFLAGFTVLLPNY